MIVVLLAVAATVGGASWVLLTEAPAAPPTLPPKPTVTFTDGVGVHNPPPSLVIYFFISTATPPEPFEYFEAEISLNGTTSAPLPLARFVPGTNYSVDGHTVQVNYTEYGTRDFGSVKPGDEIAVTYTQYVPGSYDFVLLWKADGSVLAGKPWSV